MKRAHRCIFGKAAVVRLPCPACTVRAQLTLRVCQGASANDLLFVDAEGGAVAKHAAVDTLRAILRPEGPGAISGHSMRRTGGQVLTAAGFEPWLVEWFGRWGSSAVRAYIEDARARAPEVTVLAERVCAAIQVADGGAAGAAQHAGPARPMVERPAIADIQLHAKEHNAVGGEAATRISSPRWRSPRW